MRVPAWILSISITALIVKIALVGSYGHYFTSEIQGDIHPNDIIIPTIDAVSIFTLILLVGSVIAFFKKQRGWQLYVSFPITLLALGLAPMVYVI